MGKDPFDILDEEERAPSLDVSGLKRNKARREDPQQAYTQPKQPYDHQRPSAADIARAAALEGFTARDGTGKIDGRTLRRSGRTALLSARTTPDCKDLVAEIVAKRGKPFTSGQLLEEAIELWVRHQNDPILTAKLEQFDIRGKAR